MKEELLKIAQESLSSEEVETIVKEKFMKAMGDAIEGAFRWGNVKNAIERKVTEVMVPYIENYDFTEYLPKLDAVLTEIVNSDNCMSERKMLENFRALVTDPEQKEIKLTDLFKSWIKQCERDIDTDNLEIDYDDNPSYQYVECKMRFEKEDKPSWSIFQRAVIIFENEHDEKLNIEIPVSKWIHDSDKEEPYTLSIASDIQISSLRRLSDFQVLLLRSERAGTAIIIDKEYDDGEIYPDAEPEASFS